jgi:quercetin dioxygenase-like cupin family protein
MPHSHGDSEALVVPLAGELVMTSGGQQQKVGPGDVVVLGRGEQVRLDNQTDQPVALLAVLAPPTFIGVLRGWPTS